MGVMSTLPDARATPPSPPERRRPLPSALSALGRPFLRLSFALYQLEVRRNLYPRDTPVTVVEGVDPQGLLFVGDVAASGHGVLSHGLTVSSRTAFALSGLTERGASVQVIAKTDLTMAQLAKRASLGAEDVEVAFVLLGIPDVLLGTRSGDWAVSLRAVAEKIRAESKFRAVRIVISGIPPLSDFRAISPTVRRVIDQQVDRLNAVSVEVAASIPGAVFVPFPTWRIGDMYIKQMFSWKTMHEAWGETLAAGAAPA